METISFFRKCLFTTLLLFSIPVFSNEIPRSDAAITNSVKSKIMEDKLLRNTHVNVTTTDQVVSFSGEVDSESQASTLVEIAQSTLDVKDVNTSNLTIKGSNQILSDIYLTAKVKGSFIREKLFGDKDISAWSIKVETTNAVVYLTGTSDSKTQAENAIKLAQSVIGVKQVKYRIKVMRDHVLNYDMSNY